MFWTIEKLEARIGELDKYRYRGRTPLAELRMKEDPAGEIGAYPDEGGEWRAARTGDRWRGRDAYVWLAADVRVPEEWRDRKPVGLFHFGKTGGSSGFESLLFLNGEPYQGVDSNHTEVFLPPDVCGTVVRLRFRLWSGLGGYRPEAVLEHRIEQAELAWLDEAADDLFYTGRAALDTARLLDDSRPERHALLSALDRAFLRIDWSRPGSDAFYASVREAVALLKEQLDAMPKHHAVTVRCIGHTHIDVAWLWRLKHTREKAARSFSTVLRLMELFPDYVFLQTQPQLYAYLKEDYPGLYEQIRARAAEGRWEPGGAMWLEADCNLSSGESLVRQLLYGMRFFRDEFGVECKYLWLPDVFGYSWALPQILRKAGIEAFMTTKISWNQYNRMPHDTFLWRGIDGSEILTHFITTPDPGGNEGAFYYTYNGKITPESVQGIWDAYRDKALNQELLLAYGYGDGGGGVNREMLEMRRRLDAMPGIPRVTTGRADEYFAELQETVCGTDQYVHTWDGELYLELHRGTYTSQAYNKRMNRKLELLYREAEWLNALGCLQRSDWRHYPQKALYDGWIVILRNQFHDIIPGSSIREVYEDSRAEYEEAERIGREALQGAAALLQGEGSGLQQRGGSASAATVYLAFNSAGWERTDYVELAPGYGLGVPENGACAATDGLGKPEGSLGVAEDALGSAISSFNTIENSPGEANNSLGESEDSSGTLNNSPGAPEDSPGAAGNSAYAPEDSFDAAGKGANAPEDSPGASNGHWRAADGRVLEAQRTAAGGWLLKPTGVPPMGYVRLEFAPGPGGSALTASAEPASPFAVHADGIDTPFYEIRWNGQGQLTALYDKAAGRSVLAEGARGNVLQVFEDKPKSRHEAWDIDIFYQEKMEEIADFEGAAVEEAGPLRAVVRMAWKYKDSAVEQRLIVYRDSRRIDFRTRVDWQESRRLLKAAFPVDIRSVEATYDIQFGNVKRPTHWNTSWDYARFETVGHQWADLSERGYGVSLLNDCKYGYDIKENVMRLTLIKSALVPDATADRGEHNFTYALLPHEGGWYEGRTVQEAWELNNPLHAAAGTGTGSEASFSLLSLSADHVMIDAVKKAEDEDALIVRLHEFAGARGRVTLTAGLPVRRWTECDLLERPLGSASEGAFVFDIKPYELKTFKLEI